MNVDKIKVEVASALKRTRPAERGSKSNPVVLNTTYTSKKRFEGKCFNCDTKGHRAAECRKPGGGAHSDSTSKRRDKKRNEGANIAIAMVAAAMATHETNLRRGPMDWILDGAAQCGHVAIEKSAFISETYKKIEDGQRIVGYGASLDKLENLPQVIGVGDVALTLKNGHKIVLKDVKHVPNGTANLFAIRTTVRRLQDDDHKNARYITYADTSRLLSGNNTLLTGTDDGGLLYLDLAENQDF